MEITDFRLAAALLCQGAELISSRKEINKKTGLSRVWFILGGKTEEELNDLSYKWFHYHMDGNLKTFSDKINLLNDVIASHGIGKVRHQLEEGYLQEEKP